MKNVLVTGVAGFIGMHLVKVLTESGYCIYGVDNLNSYYDRTLKEARLKELGIYLVENEVIVKSDLFQNFTFHKMDVLNKDDLFKLFKTIKFDYVIHLAAQAGVRYSITNPDVYVQSNIVGFYNILEACRSFPVKHLIFASSSSIYGLNKKIPFSTEDNTDHPISLYAASKKSNELMAYTYSHLFKIPVTGLRFFTVYGPWYRPDMAMFLFADAIFAGKPIKVFNNGQLKRDFTYIDDITTAIEKLVELAPSANDNKTQDSHYYRLLNIGNNTPVNLLDMIETLEQKLGQTAVKEYLPMQLGDVEMTYADVEPLADLTGFRPTTSLNDGIEKFANWYKSYFHIV
jgi:UDP-glucuronate 4-epimerase